MTTHDIIKHTLGSAVSAGGTFTVAYPAGRTADDYLGGVDHMLISTSCQTLFAAAGDFTVTPGASNISITLVAGVALALGAVVNVHLDRAERANAATLANPDRMSELTVARISLGQPAAASANAIVLSQAATVLASLATGINGALATGGVATIPVPRNIVAAWTGTAVLTVHGTDEYGNALRESSGSGASFTGKKAFKTVTRITVSADVTGLTVGTGVVLGLPVFIADAVDVTREIQDGAVATAGTIVAGDNAAATATTGDVRGTYAPNAAPDGTKFFELTVAVRAPAYRGRAQYAG